MWEKRYEAVSPVRTDSGRRRFSRRELQKLTLLKTLSDHGHAISTIADLSIAELERRLSETGVTTAGGAVAEKANCRICIAGELVSGLLKKGGVFPDEHVEIFCFDDIAAAELASELPESELLVVECPAFLPEDVGRINQLLSRCGASRAIVVYGYAQRYTLEEIESSVVPIAAIRTPITPAELALACTTDIAKARRSVSGVLSKAPEPRRVTDDIPVRRYDGEQLSAIAHVTSAVQCECPQHLSDLLVALGSFEDYSAACENRNEADAEIHAYLHRMTAHARAIVEDSLTVLLDYEDIELETD